MLGASGIILDHFQTCVEVAHPSEVDDALVLEDQQGNSHSIPMVLESNAKVLHWHSWNGWKDQSISRQMRIAGWNNY